MSAMKYQQVSSQNVKYMYMYIFNESPLLFQ